ncbi:MAG: beta strand repeat-containing protein [Spirulinaceae cyanobacterium]
MIFQTAKQALWRSCCFGVAVFGSFTGVISLGTCSRAIAAPDPHLPPAQANASSLTPPPPSAIRPSGNLGYNSNDLGSAPFTHLDGFFPLWQTPGENLSYVHSRLLVDNNGNLGGSLLLGYRHISESGHWVRGAYIGFDQRSTDHNTFQQLGFGLEQLGDVDLRFNAYVPIGNVRQASVNTGLQLRDLYFSGHQLNLVLEQQQVYEAAAKGFDFEVGTQLARLGTGAIKGYGAVYYYEPPQADGAFGYRVRLAANPQPHLDVGVNFQTDPFFGSQVSFQVGTSWGGRPRATASEEAPPLWTRLAEAVERTGTIAIDQQVETAFSGTIAATNPETGEAWYFLHVNPGNSGDGQFATPYATVEEALLAADARSSTANLNTTIYVQDTASPLISTVLADNVRLWSTGPLQQLNTNEFGRVTLPLSGSGIYPLLTNTVQMSDGTHLAGFTIAPAAGDEGVSANDARDLIIRDNRITTTGTVAGTTVNGGIGVNLNNSSGGVQITDNTITTSGAKSHGVQLTQINNAELSQATIAGNTVTTQGANANSINVFTASNTSSITHLTVQNNQLQTTGNEARGLSTFADENSLISQVTAQQNRIETAGVQSQAISVLVSGAAHINQATLARNQITTQGEQGNGIIAFASANAPLGQGILGELAIADNTITTQGSNAGAVLAFALNGGILNQTDLSNNTLRTTGAEAPGLLAFATGCATATCDGSSAASQLDSATITGNVIETENAYADGILAFAVKTGELSSATITGNTVTTQGAGVTSGTSTTSTYTPNTGRSGGIMAFASSDSRLDAVNLAGNTVTTTGTNSSGLAVFSVSNDNGNLDPGELPYDGSILGTATVTNNRVTTTEAGSTALLAFTTNDSTLTTAVLSGNQLQTSGANAYGISAFAAKSKKFGNAQVTNNRITTEGNQAHGINFAANNDSQIATGTISGNTSTTSGSNAYGIAVQANAGTNGGSTIDQVTITNNQAQTTNAYADALAVIVQGNGSRLNQGTIASNTLQTQGTGAQGLSVLASATATMDQLTLNSNTITTRGDCAVVSGNVVCADGINVLNLGSTIAGTTQISSNTVATAGIGAAGIVGSAIGSAQTASLAVTGNQITTTGARFNSTSALGINLSAIAGATLTNATVSSNTVTTSGERAHGLQLLATGGTMTTAQVGQNQITTGGSDAHGVFALANDNTNATPVLDGVITTAHFTENIVQATGNNANGIYTLASNGGQLDTAEFVANQFNQAVNSGVLVQTAGSGTPGLCVAGFTGNQSQVNVTDLAVFQSAGNLRFLNFSVSNIQTANPIGFDAIAFSNTAGIPNFDVAATPACP